MITKLLSYFCFLVFVLSVQLGYASTTTNVVIISTNDALQADYWQSFFDTSETQNVKYIVVYEDWPDGADNGLGSLYAFVKANAQAQKLSNLDLKQVLAAEGTVSIFHCAGMGKRLYPLTASEKNNKSAVKIPGKSGTQTILELILTHTLTLTPHQKGRLSVFWGDQIFIPSTTLTSPNDHINIFAMVGNFPNQEEWTAKNLHQYGLIIQQDSTIKLVEKTTFPNLVALVSPNGQFPKTPISIGISLGSFSLSAVMLEELLETFSEELANKTGKLNTDYHFWMPLTWTREAYFDFMITKGEHPAEILSIYDRMQTIKNRLVAISDTPLFGVQNVGENGLWLDFGGVKSYYKNMMALLSVDKTISDVLTGIFGIEKEKYYDPERNTILINCDIEELNAFNSILINVNGRKITANHSVVLNSSVNELHCDQALAYQINDNGAILLTANEVRSDVFLEKESNPIPVYSSMIQDNKELWNVILPKNTCTFEDLYRWSINTLTN